MTRWVSVHFLHMDWWSVTDWRFWILFAPQYHATMFFIALVIIVGEVLLIRREKNIEKLVDQLLRQKQKRKNTRCRVVSFTPIPRTLLRSR